MKYVVIGHARAGKTTAGKMIAEYLATEYTDTSEPIVACEAARQAALPDFDHMAHGWDCERNRPSRRNLVALGDAIKSVFGPTIFADFCFARGDVCVGVRRSSELRAIIRKYAPGLAVVCVWRSGTGDPVDNYDITPADYADVPNFTLDNRGALAETRYNLCRWLRAVSG